MSFRSKFPLILAFFLASISLFGHAKDQSYLYLRIYEKSTEGTVEMTFKDLNKALGLNLEREMEVADLKPYLPIIQSYFEERIQIRGGGKNLTLKFIEPELLKVKMGVFLRSHFELEGHTQTIENLDVDYSVLFDQDKKHQGLLVIGHHWKSGIVNNEAIPHVIFDRGNTSGSVDLSKANIWKGFYNMIRLGAYHIWIGLDHILFLLALVLPSVLRRKKDENGKTLWEPVGEFKTAFWFILKIVTCFTIAHSITLSLAALGYVNISSRIVESLIALSIGLAAFHNIRQIFGTKEWLIALGFGLFHGLGFASVLGDKGMNGDYMLPSLLGFNLGVEVGQILIIAIIFPILYLLRNKKIYKSILFYGSILLILISMYWFVERFFEVDFLLDNYIGKAKNKLFSILGL